MSILTNSCLSFSDIDPQPLEWLWPRYFPRGKISLLAGDPGSGKTSLLLDLAARLSTNDRLPPFPPNPALFQRDRTRAEKFQELLHHLHNPTPEPSPQKSPGIISLGVSPQTTPPVPDPESRTPEPEPSPAAATLLLSPEDNAADTLRPRLESLGANIDHIHTLPNFHSLVEPIIIDGEPVPPLKHLDAILQSIPNIALLIIDPITYYLGLTDRLLPNRTDAAPSPRSILHQLARLAALNNIAIILTTRLTKKCPDAEPTSLRRALGSLAFASIARTVHLLLPNSDLADDGHSLLAPLKNNLAELPPALSFFVADRLEWDPDPIFIQDPQKPLPPKQPAEDSQLGEAVKFRAALADGPVRAKSLQSQAEENLICLRTLRRAKSFLDCDGRYNHSWKAWFWSLKGDNRTILTQMQLIEKEMATSFGSESQKSYPNKKQGLSMTSNED